MMKQSIRLAACACLLLTVTSVGRAQKPELAVQTGHSRYVTTVAFSHDGKTLASGSEDNIIRLWDVLTGAELRALKGHPGSILSVALSPDGKTLASNSADSTIKLWDVSTGAELRTLKGHSFPVLEVAFSPDGKTPLRKDFRLRRKHRKSGMGC
jgi:WD40 repeat protein